DVVLLLGQQRRGRLVFLPDLFVDLSPVHRDVRRRGDAEADLVLADPHDPHFDAVADDDRFGSPARHYEHEGPSVPVCSASSRSNRCRNGYRVLYGITCIPISRSGLITIGALRFTKSSSSCAMVITVSQSSGAAELTPKRSLSASLSTQR